MGRCTRLGTIIRKAPGAPRPPCGGARSASCGACRGPHDGRLGGRRARVVPAGGPVEALLGRMLPPRDNTSVPTAARTGEFRVAADESAVSAAEAELLHGVFSLGETEVQEIMVPRVDVVAIEHGTPWSELIDKLRSSEHARFPVVDESLDSVLGILYAKDLLPSVVADEEPASWSQMIQPATFIPATKTI